MSDQNGAKRSSSVWTRVERLDAWCSTLLTNPRPEEGADMQALSDWVFPDLATRSGDVGYMLSQRAAPLSGR